MKSLRKHDLIEIDTLGIELPEEVLPLSNIPALVPPFLLRPDRVFALAR